MPGLDLMRDCVLFSRCCQVRGTRSISPWSFAQLFTWQGAHVRLSGPSPTPSTQPFDGATGAGSRSNSGSGCLRRVKPPLPLKHTQAPRVAPEFRLPGETSRWIGRGAHRHESDLCGSPLAAFCNRGLEASSRTHWDGGALGTGPTRMPAGSL